MYDKKFLRAKRVMEVVAAAFESPTVSHIADALIDVNADQVITYQEEIVNIFFVVYILIGYII